MNKKNSSLSHRGSYVVSSTLSLLVIYEHRGSEMVQIYFNQCPVTEMSRWHCRAENNFPLCFT